MSKILVVGPALGKLKALFGKIQVINTKNGPFDFALCLGDLFDGEDTQEVDDLLAGRIAVPIQCYCVMGGKRLPPKVIEQVERNHGEIAENLVFLGKQAVYTLASGLRIATVGGQFDLDQYVASETDGVSPLASPYFTASGVASFLQSLEAPTKSAAQSFANAGPRPVDILLTHGWPSDITALSSKPLDEGESITGVPAIAEILDAVRPRYHFASEQGIFWEREPFAFPSRSTDVSYTRFLSLGEFANKGKNRWFYAFNIAASNGPQARPANATACPLNVGTSGSVNRGTKRAYAQTFTNDAPPDYIFGGAGQSMGNPTPRGYVCKICSQHGHWIQDCPQASHRGAKRQHKEITPGECWFCLSNPKVTKHLITSIGEECYVTLPKGQIPDTQDSKSPVPGGGHVLIIPIGHYPTMRGIPAEQLSAISKEVEQYKSALRECYKAHDASMVTFEVGRYSGKGGHAHVQVCPVPNALAHKVPVAFREQSALEGYEFEEEQDVLDAQDITENYLRIELPDNSTLVHLLKPGKRFDLQWARSVVASLLGSPDRADWKVCARSDAEEKAEAQLFKAAFKAFDPSA